MKGFVFSKAIEMGSDELINVDLEIHVKIILFLSSCRRSRLVSAPASCPCRPEFKSLRCNPPEHDPYPPQQ